MNDYINSLIRTYVPVAVGIVAAWLATNLGVVLDEDTQTQGVVLFSAVATGIYYAVVRWVETKHPQVGWLLGKAKAPSYEPK